MKNMEALSWVLGFSSWFGWFGSQRDRPLYRFCIESLLGSKYAGLSRNLDKNAFTSETAPY
jgi:hypothetical protein